MGEGSEFESRYGQVFSHLNVVQTGPGTHPVSYPIGRGSFPGIKLTTPPTCAEVKNMSIYTSTPPHVFME
jgi:hypothetical protein